MRNIANRIEIGCALNNGIKRPQYDQYTATARSAEFRCHDNQC